LSRHISYALETFPRPKSTGADVLPFGGGKDRAHARIDALQTRLRQLIGEADRTRK
jgi:hypothetical protein